MGLYTRRPIKVLTKLVFSYKMTWIIFQRRFQPHKIQFDTLLSIVCRAKACKRNSLQCKNLITKLCNMICATWESNLCNFALSTDKWLCEISVQNLFRRNKMMDFFFLHSLVIISDIYLNCSLSRRKKCHLTHKCNFNTSHPRPLKYKYRQKCNWIQELGFICYSLRCCRYFNQNAEKSSEWK